MYCTDCGNELPYGSNYCPYDGSYQPVHSQQPVTSSPSKYCSDCGSGNDGTLYCLLCGSFLQSFIPFKRERVSEKATTPKALELPALKSTILKTGLLYGLLAFLLVGALSFMFSQLYESTSLELYEMVEDMAGISTLELVEEFYGSTEETSNFEMNSLIGFTDYWMAFHLLNSEFSFTASGADEGELPETYSGGVLINFGSMLLLLVPLVSLIVVGYLYGRRNEETVPHLWIFSLIAGGCYGILTAFLSLFAGFSFDGSVQDDWMRATLSIQNHYPFLKALFAGILIGTIGTFLGTLLGSKQIKEVTSSPLLESVKAIGIGVTICTIGMCIFMYISTDELLFSSGEVLIRDILLFAFQGGFVLWNLLNFSQFSFAFNGLGENLTLSYSVLSGMNFESSEMVDIFSLIIATSSQFNNSYMVVGFLLPVLLFVWIGYRMQQRNEEVHLQKLARFGLLYAFLMAILTAATNVGIEIYGMGMTEILMVDGVQELPKFSIGFSAIGTFFKCFIFSTALAIGGAYLKKYRMN